MQIRELIMTADVQAKLLVRRILLGDYSNTLALELLSVIHKGAPVDSLALLLDADSDSVTKIGTWILSELGKRAEPLLPFVERLLHHPSAYVRFFAIDVAISCSGTLDVRLVGRILELFEDADAGVRRKAMDFFFRVSPATIAKARVTIDAEKYSSYCRGLDLLEAPNGADIIVELATSESAIDRKFAIVAACRFDKEETVRDFLNSSDDDVANFARDVLEIGDLPTRE
jgi:hypothetical protein